MIDDLSTGFADNLDGLDVDFARASILDEAAVADAMTGRRLDRPPGCAGQRAAQHRGSRREPPANATGTLTVLEAAAQAGRQPRRCRASSSSVYGMNPALPKNEREWVRPMSPYAVSKLATEQYTLAYQQSFGLSTARVPLLQRLRPGPACRPRLCGRDPHLDRRAAARRAAVGQRRRHQLRDFTYVGTVCDVLLDAVERRVSHPEPVNLAFGTNTTLARPDRADSTTSAASSPMYATATRAPATCRTRMADNSTLRMLFPEVTAVDLSRGLERDVELVPT